MEMVEVVEILLLFRCCHCHKQGVGWLSGHQAQGPGGASGHHEDDRESELSCLAQRGV